VSEADNDTQQAKVRWTEWSTSHL